MAEVKLKDGWDKLDVLAKILIPVVIALATLSLNCNLRESGSKRGNGQRKTAKGRCVHLRSRWAFFRAT